MHSSANKKLTKSLHNLSQAIRSHVVTRKIIIARGPLLLTDPHFLNLGLLGLEFCNNLSEFLLVTGIVTNGRSHFSMCFGGRLLTKNAVFDYTSVPRCR